MAFDNEKNSLPKENLVKFQSLEDLKLKTPKKSKFDTVLKKRDVKIEQRYEDLSRICYVFLMIGFFFGLIKSLISL